VFFPCLRALEHIDVFSHVFLLVFVWEAGGAAMIRRDERQHIVGYALALVQCGHDNTVVSVRTYARGWLHIAFCRMHVVLQGFGASETSIN